MSRPIPHRPGMSVVMLAALAPIYMATPAGAQFLINKSASYAKPPASVIGGGQGGYSAPRSSGGAKLPMAAGALSVAIPMIAAAASAEQAPRGNYVPTAAKARPAAKSVRPPKTAAVKPTPFFCRAPRPEHVCHVRTCR